MATILILSCLSVSVAVEQSWIKFVITSDFRWRWEWKKMYHMVNVKTYLGYIILTLITCFTLNMSIEYHFILLSSCVMI